MSDRGVLLLEVIVALILVGTTGLGMVAVLREAEGLDRRWRQHEEQLALAADLLTSLVLLDRRNLDRRIGRQEYGQLVASVQRPEPALYRLSVAPANSPDRELLVTVVFRPRRGES